MKRIPKIYLETTVFNYFFDRDRDGHAATVALFDAIGRGEFEAYTSDITRDELLQANEPKRTDMLDLIKDFKVTVFEGNDGIKFIAGLYLEAKAIPYSHPVDATHIAFASLNDIDYLVTFNFKHINKDKTRQITGMINSRYNLQNAVITTPGDILT